MNYSIENGRIVSAGQLTAADFDAIAAQLGVAPKVYAKNGAPAAVRVVTSAEEVVTHNSTGVEARNTAEPGDAIVTRMQNGVPARNDAGQLDHYVVKADKLDALFGPGDEEVMDGGVSLGVKRPGKNVVRAIPVPGGVDIDTSFGRQSTPNGYLLNSLISGGVNGCDTAGFEPYKLVTA